MDTNRLPKQALQYKPKGQRNIGRPRKRWRDQLHLEDQGTGNTPNSSGTWWWWWKKVKCTLVLSLRLCTVRTAHRGNRGIALLFLNHGTRRGWVVSVTPRPLFTPGKTRYTLYRSLGGLQGRSGRVRKISPPPGFDPRTVQPVTRPYADWATGPAFTYRDGI